MHELEKRIHQVSEMVSQHFMEGALGFRDGTPEFYYSLWDAQECLNPDIVRYKGFIEIMCKKHKISSELIDALQIASSRSSYVVGIIAGLHLSGRSDLIPKFAGFYEEQTYDERMNVRQCTEDGAGEDRTVSLTPLKQAAGGRS